MSAAYAPVPEPNPAGLNLLKALDKIGSLQRHITVARAETMADAAVQLRRLEARPNTSAGRIILVVRRLQAN